MHNIPPNDCLTTGSLKNPTEPLRPSTVESTTLVDNKFEKSPDYDGTSRRRPSTSPREGVSRTRHTPRRHQAAHADRGHPTWNKCPVDGSPRSEPRWTAQQQYFCSTVRTQQVMPSASPRPSASNANQHCPTTASPDSHICRPRNPRAAGTRWPDDDRCVFLEQTPRPTPLPRPAASHPSFRSAH